MERRLAAIVAADVVGYSRLMELDEAGTFSRLRTHQKELFEPEIAAHHGRIFKLMGDGLLAEFASVVDAVECAIVLQREMASRNQGLPDDRRIDVRIGINLGDVIIEGEDRHGEGVNIAARLQQLAEPGGICVARNVHDQVKNKLDLRFRDLGDHTVKNIAEALQVFCVLPDGAKEPRRPPRNRHGKRYPGRVAAGAIVLLLLAAGGTIAWLRPWQPDIEPASIDRMAFPLPDKPSVAVLPFTNMSADPEQEYFADGMTDDLITDLSKVSSLFVIARNSTFAYKGRSVEMRQVAEDLGVRYVVEGSVRRAGDTVRVNAQLIDTITGGHVWADRYDGSVADIFAVQDAIVREIAEGAGPESVRGRTGRNRSWGDDQHPSARSISEGLGASVALHSRGQCQGGGAIQAGSRDRPRVRTRLCRARHRLRQGMPVDMEQRAGHECCTSQ